MIDAQNSIVASTDIDLIFVPQGSEYQAVRRGMAKREKSIPILAIPIGYQAANLYFQQWLTSPNYINKNPRQVLLMGLAGSLCEKYRIGQTVFYQQCGRISEKGEVIWYNCDFWQDEKVSLVKGWTSDHIICTTQEKHTLYNTYGVEVVDMEGLAILETLQPMGIKVSILRVISDDCQYNLPNLEGTISLDGSLKPISLALKMMQQPLASLRLIRGSLKGLKVLEQVASQINKDIK